MPTEAPPESTAVREHSHPTTLLVEGMTCHNCARHVAEAIQSVPGVAGASVNLEAGQAAVRWRAGSARDIEPVIKAVQQAGFKAGVADAEDENHCKHGISGWQLNLWIGVAGMLLLMAGEWVFGLALAPWFRWFSFVVAAVVQVFAAAPFYRGAWNQLKSGNSNMDTLVALGSSTAFGYSTWALLSGAGGHLYFMEAAAIISLISLGHWVEARVSLRASAALEKLLNLAPAQARRRNGDGSVTMLPVAELRPDDLVDLRPGERVPTDGKVMEGGATVDESMLTGESNPAEKVIGNEVYAGTTNLNGRLTVRVSGTGEDTALAQIIAAVQRAQNSRANIQRLGDRVSSVFVPIVVMVALGAGLWWGLAPERAHQLVTWLSHYLWAAHAPHGIAAAFIIAAAVLIIACPCAMGLATPAAIMAGANAAAQRGILIRDGIALEKAGDVTAVVFDKTGTLTKGRPELVEWIESSKFKLQSSNFEVRNGGPEQVLRLAAALAAHSTHPMSQAIAAKSSGTFHPRSWKEIRGSGIEAEMEWDGTANLNESRPPLRLGSLSWLKESGVDLAPEAAFISRWAAEAATIIGLARGKELLGMFAVRDALKPRAADVVQAIQRQGLKVFLLTGDNAMTAASIGRSASIASENVFAEVRPAQKAEFIKKLQGQGEHVAFVGDGINDAPALEQADLGIAVSKASDIAREAADIILLRSEIEAVPEALGLAKATLRTIKQNLFWAFFYNAVGIPLAALGFMTPILCAAAMGFSDLIVIGNALRLQRWEMSASGVARG